MGCFFPLQSLSNALLKSDQRLEFFLDQDLRLHCMGKESCLYFVLLIKSNILLNSTNTSISIRMSFTECTKFLEEVYYSSFQVWLWNKEKSSFLSIYYLQVTADTISVMPFDFQSTLPTWDSLKVSQVSTKPAQLF